MGEAVKLRDDMQRAGIPSNDSDRRQLNLIVHAGTEKTDRNTGGANPYYDPTYSHDSKAQEAINVAKDRLGKK